MSSPETYAKLHFQARAAAAGTKYLPMHATWDALTQALKPLKVCKTVSETEFDDLFMDAFLDDDEVSEKAFLELLKQVIQDAPVAVDETMIKQEFADIFKAKLTDGSSYARSARVLYRAFDNMQNAGKLKELELMPEAEIREMFEEWDTDKNGTIELEEFTDAALVVVRGSETETESYF